MRKLYEVTVVDKKTNKVLVDKKVAATGETDAVLQAADGMSLDVKNSDIVIRDLAELSKEPEVVRVESE